MHNLQALLELITLEQIELNIFRGGSRDIVGRRVYGGQVLAQSLQAAQNTVEDDRLVHSMHAYFLLGGDIERPIVYDVERLRDGGSFTTRRVTAIQHGRAIFNMSASFHKRQPGLEHQIEMPDVPPPERLMTAFELAEKHREQFPARYRGVQRQSVVVFKPVETADWSEPSNQPPRRHVWVRLNGSLDNSQQQLHRTLMAYLSDYYLLTTALQPHRGEVDYSHMQFASLDHAIWFHHDVKVDDWLLYAIDAPSASNSRGFNRGSFFTRDGKLVASVVQEGLMRIRRPK